jgi:hypothetical protein
MPSCRVKIPYQQIENGIIEIDRRSSYTQRLQVPARQWQGDYMNRDAIPWHEVKEQDWTT